MKNRRRRRFLKIYIFLYNTRQLSKWFNHFRRQEGNLYLDLTRDSIDHYYIEIIFLKTKFQIYFLI
jgi:hypothetical protein